MRSYFYSKRPCWSQHDGSPKSWRFTTESGACTGAGSINRPSCNRLGLAFLVGADTVVAADGPVRAIIVRALDSVLRYELPLEYQVAIRKWGCPKHSIPEAMPHQHSITNDPHHLPLNHSLLSCRRR